LITTYILQQGIFSSCNINTCISHISNIWKTLGNKTSNPFHKNHLGVPSTLHSTLNSARLGLDCLDYQLKERSMQCMEIASHLNMYSTWNCKKTTFISRHFMHNRSSSNTCIFSYINVTETNELSPEVWQFPPATSCSIPQGNELWTQHQILILFNNAYLFSFFCL
jgi:hypothetical protein